MENLNIGISKKEGGYRAATFHLGTLSFLNTIHIGIVVHISGNDVKRAVYLIPQSVVALFYVAAMDHHIDRSFPVNGLEQAVFFPVRIAYHQYFHAIPPSSVYPASCEVPCPDD